MISNRSLVLLANVRCMREQLWCGKSVLNGPISAKCDMIERDLGSKSTQGVFYSDSWPLWASVNRLWSTEGKAWGEIVLSSKYVQGKHSQTLMCINLHMFCHGKMAMLTNIRLVWEMRSTLALVAIFCWQLKLYFCALQILTSHLRSSSALLIYLLYGITIQPKSESTINGLSITPDMQDATAPFHLFHIFVHNPHPPLSSS